MTKKQLKRVLGMLKDRARQFLCPVWAVVTGVVFACLPGTWVEKNRAWHRRGVRFCVTTSSCFKPGTTKRYKSYHVQFNNGAGYRNGATLTFCPVGREWAAPHRRVRYWVGLTSNGNAAPLPGPY